MRVETEALKIEHLYSQYRGLLLTLAYQMTGEWSDAEDVVQDVFLKAFHAQPPGLKEESKAYLCKMVVNRCRDLHKSARKRRERYVGEWLPEPVPTSEDGPLEQIMRDELLSYATMVLLEKLSPAERAVFVLREALGIDHAGIARIIDKSEMNCRKLFSRAKGKLNEGNLEIGEQGRNKNEREAWIRQFVSAFGQDQTEQIIDMLSDDIVLVSDGGGKVSAAVRPIAGREYVMAFLLGIFRKMSQPDHEAMSFEFREINGQTGIVFLVGGQIDSVVMLQAQGQSLRRIYIIRNPDKLRNFR
ncbi:RNA polymerase sigma factor SigJ [Paenibacillus sp. PL2-23]|uniref:RNA polymerase sigma factor SigJ n=1 Tax=Paenibacillus sp. PL2-23 TaxID=2100729 RepID=UPI0030FB2A10